MSKYVGTEECGMTDVSLPLRSSDAAWFRVPHGVDAAVKVDLTSGLFIAGDLREEIDQTYTLPII